MSRHLQYGVGKCSLCGSMGASKSTCPLNKMAQNPSCKKHPKAQPCISNTSSIVVKPTIKPIKPPIKPPIKQPIKPFKPVKPVKPLIEDIDTKTDIIDDEYISDQLENIFDNMNFVDLRNTALTNKAYLAHVRKYIEMVIYRFKEKIGGYWAKHIVNSDIEKIYYLNGYLNNNTSGITITGRLGGSKEHWEWKKNLNTIKKKDDVTSWIWRSKILKGQPALYGQKFKKKFHRLHGPAQETYSSEDGKILKQKWYIDNKLHRDDGPANLEYSSTDGRILVQEWYINGKLHRKDGPAIIQIINTPRIHAQWGVTTPNSHAETIQHIWYNDNKRHRIGNPAKIIYKSDGKTMISQDWYINDKLHRDDGPAQITINTNDDIEYIEHVWYFNNAVHRTDGPAKMNYTGIDTMTKVSEVWYNKGVRHRVNAPAETHWDKNGNIIQTIWYKYNRIHRDDGPAYMVRSYEPGPDISHGIMAENYDVWYEEGIRHREGQPAEIWYNSKGKIIRELWRDNDEKHREDGPADLWYDDDGKVIKEIWAISDNKHRIGLPAEIWTDRVTGVTTVEGWYIDGVKHRKSGPALTRRTYDGRLLEMRWITDGIIKDMHTSEQIVNPVEDIEYSKGKHFEQYYHMSLMEWNESEYDKESEYYDSDSSGY